MESPDAKTNEAPCYTNTRLMLPVQIHNCKLFGSDFETWYMFCARHRGHEIVHGDMIMYVREPVKKRSFYGQADRKGLFIYYVIQFGGPGRLAALETS